jgi:transcriptional antiterminator RfaH
MTPNPSPCWYVAHTHPQAEAKASSHLVRQGFEIYLPRYRRRRRHARKIETVAAPLFPRYVFVAVDMAIQRWRSIHSTVGIARFVCNGEQPAAVPAGIVEALRAREDAEGFVTLDGRPKLRAGDKIRVLDGAFCDCLGLFEGLSDRDRVTILLELLGRKVRIVLDEQWVAAA